MSRFEMALEVYITVAVAQSAFLCSGSYTLFCYAITCSYILGKTLVSAFLT